MGFGEEGGGGADLDGGAVAGCSWSSSGDGSSDSDRGGDDSGSFENDSDSQDKQDAPCAPDTLPPPAALQLPRAAALESESALSPPRATPALAVKAKTQQEDEEGDLKEETIEHKEEKLEEGQEEGDTKEELDLQQRQQKEIRVEEGEEQEQEQVQVQEQEQEEKNGDEMDEGDVGIGEQDECLFLNLLLDDLEEAEEPSPAHRGPDIASIRHDSGDACQRSNKRLDESTQTRLLGNFEHLNAHGGRLRSGSGEGRGVSGELRSGEEGEALCTGALLTSRELPSSAHRGAADMRLYKL